MNRKDNKGLIISISLAVLMILLNIYISQNAHNQPDSRPKINAPTLTVAVPTKFLMSTVIISTPTQIKEIIPTATPTIINTQVPTSIVYDPPTPTNLPEPSGMFGAPSLSAYDVENILVERNSPAVGNGQAFYDLGIAYNIDPAYLLAFFAKESSMGADPNWYNTKNIGNIICTKNWTGKCHGRFRVYDTWAESAEDWYSLMSRKYKGQDIYSIMYQYAPKSDGNNPDKYAATVLALVNQWSTR